MRHDRGHRRMVAREPIDGVAGIPNLLHGEGLSAARDRPDLCVVCWRRWRGSRAPARRTPRPADARQHLILFLALRSGRCNRRRGKQSHHSKRSEDLRPKTIRHKRLQTGAGSLEPARKLSCGPAIHSKFNHDCRQTSSRRNRPDNYFAAGPCDIAAAGFTNFAAATAAFACILDSSVVDCPSTQVACHLKGILTPETAR